MKYKFNITNMSCTACSANIENIVKDLLKNKSVVVTVSLMTNQLVIESEDEININEVINSVTSIGYGCTYDDPNIKQTNNENLSIKNYTRNQQNIVATKKKQLIAAFIFLIPLMYFSMGHMLHIMPKQLSDLHLTLSILQLLFSFPFVVIFQNIFKDGYKAFFKKVPNMNSLIAFGSSAAIFYGIYVILRLTISTTGALAHNLYFESAGMILTLVSLGKYFEEKSKLKTTNAITLLMKLKPKSARLLINGNEKIINSVDIKIGDILIVKPGENIPTDGIVIDGISSVNESSISGESIPVDKIKGDKVLTATTNTYGVLTIRATANGNNTSLDQIIELIENTSSKKANISKLADKISLYFVPTIIVLSLIVFIVWVSSTRNFDKSFNFAISVLVISCPCALGLATPIAIMVATGKGAKNGILIKSPDSLEELNLCNTVVLDKTGTITYGILDVTQITSYIDENDFNNLLFAIENNSEHPIGKAIVNYLEDKVLEKLPVSNFFALPGNGVKGNINQKTYYAGNLDLLTSLNIKIDDIENKNILDSTSIYLCDNKNLLGYVVLKDKIKEESKDAIELLKSKNKKVIILTGDNKETAISVKNQVNADDVIYNVKPQEKAQHIKNLMDHGTKVVMIGDGINDAPALTQANVGIALGSGSDIAIETGDIVLVKNSLMDIVNTIDLSKKTISIIKGNLFWAFLYNVIAIPIAAGVFFPLTEISLSPMIASLAMSISSVSVVTNSLRINSIKMIKSKQYKINNTKETTSMKTTTIKMEGLMCNHCVQNVQNALMKIKGVQNVQVTLDNQTATITHDNIDTALFKDAISTIGYTVIEIN